MPGDLFFGARSCRDATPQLHKIQSGFCVSVSPSHRYGPLASRPGIDNPWDQGRICMSGHVRLNLMGTPALEVSFPFLLVLPWVLYGTRFISQVPDLLPWIRNLRHNFFLQRCKAAEGNNDVSRQKQRCFRFIVWKFEEPHKQLRQLSYDLWKKKSIKLAFIFLLF